MDVLCDLPGMDIAVDETSVYLSEDVAIWSSSGYAELRIGLCRVRDYVELAEVVVPLMVVHLRMHEDQGGEG